MCGRSARLGWRTRRSPDTDPARTAAAWGLPTGAAVRVRPRTRQPGRGAHRLGGFPVERASAGLAVPRTVIPVVLLAVGCRDTTAEPAEPFAAHQTAVR